jgi:hypothetical protein
LRYDDRHKHERGTQSVMYAQGHGVEGGGSGVWVWRFGGGGDGQHSTPQHHHDTRTHCRVAIARGSPLSYGSEMTRRHHRSWHHGSSCRNRNNENRSCRLFCKGVPVTAQRCMEDRLWQALATSVNRFLMRCAWTTTQVQPAISGGWGGGGVGGRKPTARQRNVAAYLIQDHPIPSDPKQQVRPPTAPTLGCDCTVACDHKVVVFQLLSTKGRKEITAIHLHPQRLRL